MHQFKVKSAILGALATAAALLATPASAITIVLHDLGGSVAVAGTPAEKGFKTAARYWESVLTNNATIELNVGYGVLDPGVLGSTWSNTVPYVPISAYYGALAATQTSALDALAVSNLSALNGNGSVSALVPAYLSPGLGIDVAGGTRLAPDDYISSTLALNTANAKALGFNLGPAVLDAEILFSNELPFDFDPSDGIAPGRYDFLGVAIHEIGHALGFVSSADDFDYFNGSPDPVDNGWWAYGLDLFRYSAPGQLNWAPDQPSYFSVDGGASALYNGYFSTGTSTGDGNQASHWKQPDQATPCQGFLGMMNPYICGGKTDSVSALDLAAFDVIGWNLSVDVSAEPDYDRSTASIYREFAVPEPATWASLAMAFGVMGLTTRRRKAAKAAA